MWEQSPPGTNLYKKESRMSVSESRQSMTKDEGDRPIPRRILEVRKRKRKERESPSDPVSARLFRGTAYYEPPPLELRFS